MNSTLPRNQSPVLSNCHRQIGSGSPKRRLSLISITALALMVSACETPSGIDADPIRFHIFSDYFPTPHPDGVKIAFYRERGPHWVRGEPLGILMQNELSNEISIIDTLGYGRPQWIDDSHIVYKTEVYGVSTLAIHDINNNTRSFLDYGGAQIFHISQSDSLIAFHSDDGRIRIFNITDHELQYVSGCCYYQPYWMLDTENLLVSYCDTPHSRVIASLSISDSNLRIITKSNNDRSDQYPCLSNDGMYIVFHRIFSGSGVYLTDPEGTFETFISDGRYPCFDIDNSGLYFSKTSYYGYRIFYYSFSDNIATLLTTR